MRLNRRAQFIDNHKEKAMSYVLTSQQFAGKIKSISSTRAKFSEDVHQALIGAVYLCLKNSGGTTPFQQIRDAVGTTAHRQGIIQWVETYAPVMLRDDKIVLNKTAYSGLDRDAILADFDAYVEESGMNDVKWDSIAKEKNTEESIWNYGGAVESLCKKLEKNGQIELAVEMRQAFDRYMVKAIKAELTVGA